MIITGNMPYNGMLTMMGQACIYYKPSLRYSNDNRPKHKRPNWQAEEIGDFMDRCARISGLDGAPLSIKFEHYLWEKGEL